MEGIQLWLNAQQTGMVTAGMLLCLSILCCTNHGLHIRMYVSDANKQTRLQLLLQTNSSGLYVFSNITAGYTYSIDAFSSNHSATSRTVAITGM